MTGKVQFGFQKADGRYKWRSFNTLGESPINASSQSEGPLDRIWDLLPINEMDRKSLESDPLKRYAMSRAENFARPCSTIILRGLDSRQMLGFGFTISTPAARQLRIIRYGFLYEDYPNANFVFRYRCGHWTVHFG